MKLSIRRWVGLGGLVLLLAAIQIAASVRRDEWESLFSASSWFGSFVPAAFLGSWGWVTLFAAGQSTSAIAARLLILLAVAYFGYAAFLCYDIVVNGNSTSGIAFFFFPGAAAFVMVPLIGLIAFVGWKIDGEEAG
jgi:hypothetical protein